MKLNWLVVLFFFSIGLSAQSDQDIIEKSISTKIVELKEKISNRDTVKVDGSGFFENEYAIQIGEQATKDELITLTNDDNPLIRFYSIYYLTQKFNDIPYLEIVKKHLNDTAIVLISEWQYASHSPPKRTFYQERLNEDFIQFIGYSQFVSCRSTQYMYRSFLSKNKIEYDKIDSLLLCEPNNLTYTTNLILSNKPIKGCYECVRKSIVVDKNHKAIVLLSAYQNKKDIGLIIQNINLGSTNDVRTKFGAFINFKNPTLFKFLKQNVNKYYQIDNYLMAVAGYKNNEALEILENAFKMPKNMIFISNLNRAIQSNFTENYTDLLFRVLEYELSPFINFPNKLWQYDKERTFALLLKILDKDYSRECGSVRRKMMLNKVEKTIKENAPDLMIRFNESIKN